MKRIFLLLISIVLLSHPLPAAPDSVFENFITRDGDKLMDGDTEFRFISYNASNLNYHEDNFPFDNPSPWRIPDEYELRDSIETLRRTGGRVVRLYCFSVAEKDQDPSIPKHVLGPGQFNEEMFRALDKALQIANQKGVRLIIPFIDNHHWWGGLAEYAAFRGKGKDDFWTDPQLIADFKQTIDYVINRTNHYTGTKYKDDKAILAWETGNELACPQSWTHEIAAYVKSLDRNHLLIDGFHTKLLKAEQLEEPNVDIVVTHEYPKEPVKMFERVLKSRWMAKGKKAYIIGEFGFMTTQAVEEFLDLIIENQVSGALFWGLRFHNRDGGFYWHSEPWGVDVFKSYHWPGFAAGQRYDERHVLALMRKKAFEIRGVPLPPIEKPDAPHLLPIEDAAAISWQGSAGADRYDLERAGNAGGPWTLVGKDISDAAVQFRPLFNDSGAEIGKSYYYRVTAKNAAGKSQHSNTVGPVKVERLHLVDEMKDFHKMYAFSGKVNIESADARKYKEDIHRLRGDKDINIVYKVDGPIGSFKVYAFFGEKISDLEFAASTDGKRFKKIRPKRTDYSGGENFYGYSRPILYKATDIPEDSKFLAIAFTDEAQISRIEIYYGQ